MATPQSWRCVGICQWAIDEGHSRHGPLDSTVSNMCCYHRFLRQSDCWPVEVERSGGQIRLRHSLVELAAIDCRAAGLPSRRTAAVVVAWDAHIQADHRFVSHWPATCSMACGRVAPAETVRQQPRDGGRRWCFDAGSWGIRAAELARRGRGGPGRPIVDSPPMVRSSTVRMHVSDRITLTRLNPLGNSNKSDKDACASASTPESPLSMFEELLKTVVEHAQMWSTLRSSQPLGNADSMFQRAV